MSGKMTTSGPSAMYVASEALQKSYQRRHNMQHPTQAGHDRTPERGGGIPMYSFRQPIGFNSDRAS